MKSSLADLLEPQHALPPLFACKAAWAYSPRTSSLSFWSFMSPPWAEATTNIDGSRQNNGQWQHGVPLAVPASFSPISQNACKACFIRQGRNPCNGLAKVQVLADSPGAIISTILDKSRAPHASA